MYQVSYLALSRNNPTAPLIEWNELLRENTMLNLLKKLCLVGALATLTACGFHFENGELIPQEMKTLRLESSDPYDAMTIAMRKQLRANNIQLVEQGDVVVLRLNNARENSEVASIFKQGREAEKVLVLQVEASVQLKNKQRYPISTQVTRTFFDNSRAALAKSAEKEVIWNDMREQAARQLITKMVALKQQVKSQ